MSAKMPYAIDEQIPYVPKPREPVPGFVFDAAVARSHDLEDYLKRIQKILEAPDWYESETMVDILLERLGQIIDEAIPQDPTPWCSGCGSMTKAGCHCGPLAENE